MMDGKGIVVSNFAVDKELGIAFIYRRESGLFKGFKQQAAALSKPIRFLDTNSNRRIRENCIHVCQVTQPDVVINTYL